VSRIIPQRELRNDNARVIDAVVAGESFLVSRNGVVVAALHPVRPHRRSLVPRAEFVELCAAGTGVDADLFRADLERAIDQGL
jgi:antitoxin (DNA-binding transcriptional repressor) of toxin-antitoxin stability system